jgi:hypothetical protein
VFIKKKDNDMKTWNFSYIVEFLDGLKEDRVGWVEAMHFANAADKAQALIETRVEADEYIKGAVILGVNLDEEE